MSEIVLITIGNSAAEELEPGGASLTMVENLVIKLDTIIENSIATYMNFVHLKYNMPL